MNRWQRLALRSLCALAILAAIAIIAGLAYPENSNEGDRPPARLSSNELERIVIKIPTVSPGLLAGDAARERLGGLSGTELLNPDGSPRTPEVLVSNADDDSPLVSRDAAYLLLALVLAACGFFGMYRLGRVRR
jgi:hypothetical protein